MNNDAVPLADVLVIGTLVCILEAPPSADVIHKDGAKFCRPSLYIRQELLERIATGEPEATFACVLISAYNPDSMLLGVFANRVALILGGILLMFSGHAHVFRCANHHALTDLTASNFCCHMGERSRRTRPI